MILEIFEAVFGVSGVVSLVKCQVLDKHPKVRPALGWHGGRTEPEDRPYECLCLHLPTSHKRIEFYDKDGNLYVKFGKCKANLSKKRGNEKDPCACTGYMGPLPPEMLSQIAMPVIDGQPVTDVPPLVEKKVRELLVEAGSGIADAVTEKVKLRIDNSARLLQRQIHANNLEQLTRWERTHQRVRGAGEPYPPGEEWTLTGY